MCKDPLGHLRSIYTFRQKYVSRLNYFLHCVIQNRQDSLYMAKDKVGWEARLIIISTKSIGVHIFGLHPCVLVIV